MTAVAASAHRPAKARCRRARRTILLTLGAMVL